MMPIWRIQLSRYLNSAVAYVDYAVPSYPDESPYQPVSAREGDPNLFSVLDHFLAGHNKLKRHNERFTSSFSW